MEGFVSLMPISGGVLELATGGRSNGIARYLKSALNVGYPIKWAVNP